MSHDPDVEASPLRRRRSTATQIVASPPEEPATVAPEADETPGRPPRRRHISRRYLATVFAGSLVVATLVGLVAAYATSKAAPRYQSLALVEIDQPRAIAVSPDDGVVAKLSRLRYKYSGLMRTDTFAAPVARKLGLNVNQVTGSVFAVVDASSLLIGVGAQSGNPTDAQRIASAAATGLTDFVRTEQTNDSIPASEQVTFTVVSPASPGVKISPTHTRIVLVGLGSFAFIVAGSLAFGYFWRRDY